MKVTESEDCTDWPERLEKIVEDLNNKNPDLNLISMQPMTAPTGNIFKLRLREAKNNEI